MAKKIQANTPLKIAGGKPASDAFLNTFFKVFSMSNIQAFESLYSELESKLKFLKIDGPSFMEQIRDSYTRYQKYKNLDSFTPMDSKAEKYVVSYMRKTINEVYKVAKKGKNKINNGEGLL